MALLGIGGAALATGVYEQPRERKWFASRAACEQALRRHHREALARLEAMPAAERGTSRVVPPERDDDGRLTFFETLDLSVTTAQLVMANGQSREYSCRGRRLERRTYLEGGGFQFFPPPPPPEPPPPVQEVPQP
ncbi:MAG TPA: hypothetical protein VFZ91_11390 [Allosphingosinicella sp.]